MGWVSPPTRVYVGDLYGNPRNLWVGVFQVRRHIKIGIRLADEGDPDYTLDEEACGEIITILRTQLKDLTMRTGGFGGGR